ncbi:hypothetical protein GCM10010149_88270 [Nonomuraea roseoviolacea subsp. roseoviolacea]|uniref:hypothetical protein n=1 Tax=Nonomuraea roseoviolacea TaxID=103837 RepID=UPI0031D8D822
MSSGLPHLAELIWSAAEGNTLYGPCKRMLKMLVSYELSEDSAQSELVAQEARLEFFARYLKETVLEVFDLDTSTNAWFLAGLLWGKADGEARR